MEDSGYDPKKAVLATQKLIEKDKIFVNLGSMGLPTVLAAQDITLDAGVLQLFPLTAALARAGRCDVFEPWRILPRIGKRACRCEAPWS